MRHTIINFLGQNKVAESQGQIKLAAEKQAKSKDRMRTVDSRRSR